MPATTNYAPCPECGSNNVAVMENSSAGADGPITISCLDCPHELFVPAVAAEGPRITKLRAIVTGHSARRIDGMIVDAFTANMLVTVYEALSAPNREKFETLPLLKVVEVGWKAVK